jgi:sirohydrochlorin cobaltochelatase
VDVVGNFTDSALLLIGHGSTVNAASGAPTYQHADELRRRRVFAQVEEAFWKQTPGIQSVLRGLTARRVFIVPLFVSEGYFTEEIIPRELGLRLEDEANFARVQQRGSQTLFYCAPVGTHQTMSRLVLARAREVVERYPFPRPPKTQEIALFIAGHGTNRNENSRRAIDRQAELIRTQNIYAEVHSVFLEEDPRVGDCYSLTRANNLVMVPFFISDGLHSAEDIPLMLGEPERIVRERLRNGQPAWRNPTERHGKLVWYGRGVGTDPQLADVVLERVAQAAAVTSPAR